MNPDFQYAHALRLLNYNIRGDPNWNLERALNFKRETGKKSQQPCQSPTIRFVFISANVAHYEYCFALHITA